MDKTTKPDHSEIPAMAHTGSLRNPAAGNLHQPASVTARINYSLRQPGKELYTYIGEKPGA